MKGPRVKWLCGMLAVLFLVSALGCASGPLTTREKGAGIGALGGAAVGGIIGNQTGHPAAGAVIGGTFGALFGWLLGDQFQKQDQEQERKRHCHPYNSTSDYQQHYGKNFLDYGDHGYCHEH